MQNERKLKNKTKENEDMKRNNLMNDVIFSANQGMKK